jgi:hypothetical protein
LVDICIVTLGLHFATLHIPDREMNDFNPGVHAEAENGVSVGFYRNSIRKESLYIAETFSLDSIDLTVGGVTGYSKPVVPLLVPSVKFGLGDGWAGRVTMIAPIPKLTPLAFHFSVEYNFR